jgi:hypothetical protein
LILPTEFLVRVWVFFCASRVSERDGRPTLRQHSVDVRKGTRIQTQKKKFTVLVFQVGRKTNRRTTWHCRRTEGNSNTKQFDDVVVILKKKGFSDWSKIITYRVLSWLCQDKTWSESRQNLVYYESIKWKIKIKHISECRCNERLKTRSEESTRLVYTGLLGNQNSVDFVPYCFSPHFSPVQKGSRRGHNKTGCVSRQTQSTSFTCLFVSE